MQRFIPWSVGLPQSEEKWAYYGGDLASPQTFSHDGADGIFYWVDPVNEIIGVYFSVVLSFIRPGINRYYADFFVNAATAAIEG